MAVIEHLLGQRVDGTGTRLRCRSHAAGMAVPAGEGTT
jgi:hypothetical protein